MSNLPEFLTIKLEQQYGKEIKFQGYLQDNLCVTKHGFAYLKITQDILDNYGVDAATAGNMVNDFNYISEVYAWGIFSYDKQNNNIRGSIRSRGPVINEIAAKYNGGGHKLASGAKVMTMDEAEALIKDLDATCCKYIESLDNEVVE